MVSSILVIGAGELGNAVLRSLASHPARSNTKISLLMRPASITVNDETKKQVLANLEALDIGVVAGDVLEDSNEELAQIFRAYHTVIGCSGMAMPAGSQVKIAKAVLASGCQRYFPWQFGIDYDILGQDSAQDLFTEQLDVRGMLRAQSELEWVIVSTGIFTSFIFEPSFGIVNAERTAVMALGSWENHVTATAPEDIGKVVAEIALSKPDVKGVIFEAGDTVSMRQIADIVDRVLEKKVDRSVKTVEQLKQKLAADPNNGMTKYRVVFAEGKGI